jgi:hypothetical protein
LSVQGTPESFGVQKVLATKAGVHASTEPMLLVKARLFAATVTLRDYHRTDIGRTSLVTTSWKEVYFCSRLCRNVYKVRLQATLYPDYFPDCEERRWDKAHPGWDCNVEKPSLLDYVPFDDPEAPACITCEHGAEDANSDGDAVCFHEDGCSDEEPFKHYQKRKPKENETR